MAEPMQVDEDDGVFTEPADEAAPMQLEDTDTATQVSQASLDPETYAASYQGHTKIARLRFIAERCPPLQIEALRLCYEALKESPDVNQLVEVAKKLNELCATQNLPLVEVPDETYIQSVNAKTTQQREKLEVDLKGYRHNMVKESIRIGHNDLGFHFYSCGDLANALKCYSRARDYCTSSKHVVEMCTNVIKVSVEMNNWGHVKNYVAKASGVADIPPQTACMLQACSGLAILAEGQYKAAARCFLDLPAEHCSNFPSLFSPRDLGIYGVLCSLATFERKELKKHVVDNLSFRQLLEHVPEFREALKDFYSSRYTTCLKTLNAFRADLLLDIHLHSHVETLYKKIRNKALVQYFSPFLSVDMRQMAEAFNCSVESLELELANLIVDRQIQARIDSDKKVLTARSRNQRTDMFVKALDAGRAFETHSQAALLRIAMQKAGLVVSTKGSGKQQGEAAAGAGAYDSANA